VTLATQSLASVSSEVAQQDNGGANQNTIATVSVFPNDRRIEYKPDSAWVDTASESGVGNCNNNTKVTTRQGANFTFAFRGTDISLFIIPSSSGGAFTVQIDGDQASSYSSQGFSGGCIPSQIFSKNGLTDGAHELTVKNGGGVTGSGAGTLEFNSIVYTGKGAFGTSVGTSKKNNSAVIGGSVGGVIGAVVLVGVGILFWLRRRKQNAGGAPTAAVPATPNQPMLYNQPPTSPYSPGTQYTPGTGEPTSPVMSQHSMAYTGMQHGPQPSGSQPAWGGYQGDPSRPASGVGAAVAPLPMWVERARRDDATSMAGTQTSDHNSLPPGAQAGQLYGAYHPANAPSWGAR